MHWLTWPLIIFMWQSFVYLYLFSNNGYLAHANLKKESKKLDSQIKFLEDEIQHLEIKLTQIQNNEISEQTIMKEFGLYDQNAFILKFNSKKKQNIKINPHKDLYLKQIKYLLISTIIQIFVTILFYYVYKYQNKKL